MEDSKSKITRLRRKWRLGRNRQAMGYTLFAILAQPQALALDPPWISDSRVIALEQGIRMLPVTAALYDGLVRQHVPDPTEDWAGFIFFPAPLVAVLSRLSERGMVAYVGADFSGEAGTQCCVVWHGGDIKLRALNGKRAINKALNRLGVRRQLFKTSLRRLV